MLCFCFCFCFPGQFSPKTGLPGSAALTMLLSLGLFRAEGPFKGNVNLNDYCRRICAVNMRTDAGMQMSLRDHDKGWGALFVFSFLCCVVFELS